MRKRDDGILLIDPVKARGRKDLVEACPYGHIWWNEELALPQLWPFDAHLLDQGWKQTRGQQSCPTGAMRAIKVEDDPEERPPEMAKQSKLGDGRQRFIMKERGRGYVAEPVRRSRSKQPPPKSPDEPTVSRLFDDRRQRLEKDLEAQRQQVRDGLLLEAARGDGGRVEGPILVEHRS